MAEADAPRTRAATAAAAESRRGRYTPELLADTRRRYEQTPERAALIAADLGCHVMTLHKLAKRESWVRYRPPPRDLPAHARLARAAEELEGRMRGDASTLPPRSGGEGRIAIAENDCTSGWGASCEIAIPQDGEVPPPPSDPPSLRSGAAKPSPSFPAQMGRGEEAVPVQSAGPPPDVVQTIDRLEREVNAQIDLIERARLARQAQPPTRYEAAQIASVLASLAATLERIRRLRAGAPFPAQPVTTRDDDDLPADLDEFRRVLARRIAAVLAERRSAAGA